MHTVHLNTKYYFLSTNGHTQVAQKAQSVIALCNPVEVLFCLDHKIKLFFVAAHVAA